MRPQLIIFDFDGTLADTYPWFTRVFNRAADQFKFRKIDLSEVDSVRAESAKKMIKRFGIPLWKIPLIARRVRQWMGDDIHGIELFPGIRDLLNDLIRRNISIAILTSNSCANVRQVLGPELSEKVIHWECDVSLSGKKRKMKKILRKCGVSPGDCLAVGDEIRDLLASKKVGIPFAGVTWGYNSAESLIRNGAGLLFHRVEEMVRYLKKAESLSKQSK